MKIFASFICLFICYHLQGQDPSRFQRYLGGFAVDTTDAAKPQFLVYPTIGFSPETNLEVGFSGLYLYYRHQDTTNRLSEFSGRIFYTLERQYGAFLEHALYSDNNEWFYLGDLRYQSFPMLFYGVGIDARLADEQMVDISQFIIKERVLKKISKNFFAGVEMEFSRTTGVSFSNPELVEQDPGIIGENGANNFGLGLGLVLDTRHNVLNVRNGHFSELAFLHSSRHWGSDYNFSYLISDTRYFKAFRKHQVLALQLLGQFNIGDVPFNQLPQLGGPKILRGYYMGRYRDKNLLAAQMEYRFLPIPLNFTKRLGAVVFASAGTVYNESAQVSFNNLKGAVGTGLRFLLFPKKDIFVRLDYAITGEGDAFYIFIGEAF